MSRTLVCVAACGLLALAACSDDGSSNTDPDGGVDAIPSPDAAVDLSDALFPTDRVIEVSITLPAADWQALRNQAPPPGQSDDRCSGPASAPGYTYYRAAITVDGVTTTDVAVRKKGNLGSLSTSKPGLKIKANEYVMGQRVSGLKQLTLNNNHQDGTLISQCLGYSLFRAAGLPASRCGFAHVTVNGEDLGLYSNVESINNDFLGRRFADDSGRLYESGGEFAPGATGGFVTKDTPADCSDIDAVVSALGAPDAELPARLDAVLDTDEFLRFWAMEVITDHWDGYANNQNNYYFYDDPSTGKISFIPWGIDALFTGRERTTRPYSVFACGSIPWRLYSVPATRARYLSTMRMLLATVWNETSIRAEIDRLQALATPYADAGLAGRIDATRRFVAGQRAKLTAELDAGDPVWPYAAGQPSCRINVGTITANFTTTWGTLGTFPAGSGSTSGTVNGTSVASSTVFATAGFGDDGKPAAQILGQLPDGRYAVVFLIVNDPANVRPGTRPIDLLNVASLMTFYDPPTDSAHGGGLLLPGTVTFTQASTADGATISGTVTGTVVEL